MTPDQPSDLPRSQTAATSGTQPPVVLHARVVCGEGGGPEKTILSSPKFLAERGYRGLCAYMRPPHDPGFAAIRDKAAALQTPLIEIDDRGAWDFGVLRALVRICREQQVAIWHGHDYKSNALGLAIRRWRPMHLVSTVHGWVKFTRRTPAYYKLDRMCLRRYDRVICVSDDLVDQCHNFGVPQNRCTLIRNAIDLDLYTRRLPVDRAKLELERSPNRLLVGAAGRLSPEKGFDLLIRAFDRALTAGVAADLVILGEGDDRPRLEALVAELGRGQEIHLPGYQNNLPQWQQALDLFVLSSLREGLPNVLLEAMALAVPVLSTHVAGVPALIRHDVEGRLIPIGSEEALATELTTLLNDDQLRARLATAGRMAIERDYSFARRMDRISDVYASLLTSK